MPHKGSRLVTIVHWSEDTLLHWHILGKILNLPQSSAVIGIVTVTEHCHRINVLAFLLHLWSSGKAALCDNVVFHYLFDIGTCSLETAALGSTSTVRRGLVFSVLLYQRNFIQMRDYDRKAILQNKYSNHPQKFPYLLYQGYF